MTLLKIPDATINNHIDGGNHRKRSGLIHRKLGRGFEPAFLDTETGHVYVCLRIDGTPSSTHRIDTLPNEVVLQRDGVGRVIAPKATLVAGFAKGREFFTRELVVRELPDWGETTATSG